MSDENTMSQEAGEIHDLLRKRPFTASELIGMKNTAERYHDLMRMAATTRDREHWAMYAAAALNHEQKVFTVPNVRVVAQSCAEYADEMLEAEKQRWEEHA